MKNKNNSLFESRNPIVSERVLNGNQDHERYGLELESSRMTVEGAVNKTLILTIIMSVFALIGYVMFNPLFMWGGAIGGLIVVIAATFKPEYSNILAPIYAVLEGLFVGAISYAYTSQTAGIIFHAVTLTLALLFIMLFLYKAKLVTVSEKFRSGVMMATMGIFVVYLISFGLSFFGVVMPYLHDNGMIGIGISVFIVGIATLNLLLDFDNFEKGEEQQLPKYYEWYFAMSLLITLVWLYIEMLRLLSKLKSD